MAETEGLKLGNHLRRFIKNLMRALSLGSKSKFIKRR